jgi:hypothetical protein
LAQYPSLQPLASPELYENRWTKEQEWRAHLSLMNNDIAHLETQFFGRCLAWFVKERLHASLDLEKI